MHSFLKGLIIGAVVSSLLIAEGCTKKVEPVVVAPDPVVQVAPNVVATPSTVTTVGTAGTVAVVPKPVVVAKATHSVTSKSHVSKAELAAYKKAYANAARANALLGEHRYAETAPVVAKHVAKHVKAHKVKPPHDFMLDKTPAK
jgi:hypothetical protein